MTQAHETLSPETLQVMPREMRLMAERIFSLTALPKGFALTLSDLPMYSELQGLGGFALLERCFAALKDADAGALTVLAEAGPALSLDARGQHAWIAVQTALDLAGELVAAHGRAEVTVANALDPAELALAEGLAPRAGLRVRVVQGALPVLMAEAGPLADPILKQAQAQGAPIEAALWWRIYALAKTALAPDTPVSRRHAGVIIVAEDGTVIGRKDNDDESDTALMTRARVTEEGAGA